MGYTRQFHSRKIVNKKVESRQEKQKETHDKNQPLRKFNVGDLVLAEDCRVTESKWIPGTLLTVTGPLSYQIKLVNGDTVRRHIDNVRRRYSAVDIDITTSTDFKPQTNSDNAPVDIAVESTVNSESFTEQSSPVPAPMSTNGHSSSLESQVDMSSVNVPVRCSTRTSRPSESVFYLLILIEYCMFCIVIFVF